MSKKRNCKVGILLVIILLLNTTVFAFGVGFPYHTDHPLEMSIGDTKEVKFRLQNSDSDRDILLRPSIVKGSGIIELESEDKILVSVGETVYVYGTVKAPSDAKIGDVYPIEVEFTTVQESQAGAFGLGTGIGRKFNVVIVPSPEEKEIIQTAPEIPTPTSFYIIVGVVVILIIVTIVLIILKKRKNKEKRNQLIPQSSQTN